MGTRQHREQVAEQQARALGAEHGAKHIAPYGDLWDAGSADLMNALGETGWCDTDRHRRLVTAYEDGHAAGLDGQRSSLT